MAADVLPAESERRILEMVEQQLDRRNPPNTKVLYRRAIHFIDSRVRELSVVQFNAMFPLQVKRRRARDRAEGVGTRRSAGSNGGDREARAASEVSGDDETSPGDGDERVPDGTRRQLRDVFIEYAHLVSTAEGSAGLVDAYRRVGSYVDRALEEL